MLAQVYFLRMSSDYEDYYFSRKTIMSNHDTVYHVLCWKCNDTRVSLLSGDRSLSDNYATYIEFLKTEKTNILIYKHLLRLF